jgi:hypothetical protein
MLIPIGQLKRPHYTIDLKLPDSVAWPDYPNPHGLVEELAESLPDRP